jgi:cation-transporting ATPase 13A1
LPSTIKVDLSEKAYLVRNVTHPNSTANPNLENRGMYWGIIGVSAIAFSCSTEFLPEINEKMRLVPFTSDFKVTMTATMILDYVGCFVIEKILKTLFSDYKPKDIAVRRPDQLAREEARREQALKDKYKAEEEKAAKQIEELEKKLQEKQANQAASSRQTGQRRVQ